MTQDTPTKVLSTEELLKRFNAQKAGQVEPLKKDPWGYEPVDIDVMLSAEAPKRASETLTESFKQKYPDFEERTMSIPGPYGQPAGQRTIPYSATAAKDTALNKQFQTDYKKYKAEHDRLSGLEDIGVKDSDIPKLRENAVSTRDSLRNLAKKIEDEYLREFKMPKVSYMQPGGQGTYNFESPGQSKAFYEYQDAKNKLDQAVRYLDRAINIPDTKKEAGKAAFENELHNIISAGISGMLEDINTARAAKGLAKGDKDDISKALVDAYGQLQTLTSIASANIPRYRRALSVAGSIPYMEQFALTGGIGTSAGATAKAAGQAVTKGITNKFVKGLTRRAVQYPIEGAISMIGRVPLSPATYAGIAQQGIGELKKVDGKYYIDPNAMPTIGQAIASGVYNSAKEIFSESLGGMIDLPAGLFPDAIVKAIGPGVKQFFKMVGMNNPQGEFFEEMVSQALGGENPLDPEFLKDLAVTIPIITGGFSALSVPSVAGQIKINYDKKKVVDTFGWDTVNEIYDIIQTGDANAVSAKLYELQNPKAGWKDYDNLIKYAASLVQEKTQEDMADQPASTENIQQQEDIDAENQVRAKGREYTLGGFNDQDPGANVIRYADTRDKRKVIIISGKHIEGSGTIYTVRDANSPDAPVQMISEKDVVNTLNVPYEEWVQNELRQYHEIRNQVDSDMAKANAPVQEGQEITLENKSWIVTRVTPEGVTLNEISQEGNITGNIQQVTPDQYNNVFVAPPTDQAQETPAEQTAGQPITGTVQAEVPIPEAQQQARKISDGRNEFTVSPREDGNFQVAETFQTQKEAETTIKKLQALYPKLKWEYEMEDSGDYFTPDIYRIVAKIPRKKEVVQQPQAEATPIEQETPKIAPIETPIEAPAQTELQAQGQIENIEKQPPVVEQTAAPLTPGETVPVEAEMQEAGEVEIAEPREVEPEQKTERPANLQPISVFKPGDRIRNSAGDVWEVVEVPGDENKPAVLRDIQDGTTTDWNQKIASWTLEKKEESPEIQMMKANREVDPNPSEAQKEAGNYQKGHIKWQGMDITIETAPMTIRKGTDKSGKEWKQLMHNAYGYIRRTLGPKTEGKDQVDVFLGDNLESETVYVIDQVDPRTQLFDEPKTMIGFNSAEEASQAYLANYEPGWKGLGAITPMPVSEFKEWVFDRTKTSRPVDPSVKVSGDSPQTTSESKDTKKEDTSQNVKDRNLEFAGEVFELKTELYQQAEKILNEKTGARKLVAITELINKSTDIEGLKSLLDLDYVKKSMDLPKEVNSRIQYLERHPELIEAKKVEETYTAPNSNLTWDEIVDKYESDLKSIDAFYNIKVIDSRKIGKETIKGKVKINNLRLGLAKEFPNKKAAQDWIESEGTDIYNNEVAKRKAAYEKFKITDQREKDNISQEAKDKNMEFAGEFLEKRAEPGPSVNLKIEPPAEPATTKPIDKESLPKHEDFGEKIGGARKDMGITRTVRDTDALPAWRRKYFYADPSGVMNLGDPTIDTSKPFLVKWSKEVKSWSGTRTMGYPVTTIDTRETKIFNSEAEAEAYIPIYEVWKQGFRIRKKDGNYVITKTSSTGKVVEYATFPTEEEATTYLYSTEGATSLLNHKREDFSIPALDKVERTGKDWRQGRDVSTEEFMDAFGFRGGEFGNWVKPEERRVMLNAAYDSFMDLAEMLKVPPKAMSLSGELSIAFGARGTKGAAAHFEPGRAVINMTRMNGAGSLAHEWAHALDNYFGLQAAKKDYTRNEKGEVAAGAVMRTKADLLSKRGMRKELSELFDAIVNATQEKSVTRVMRIEEKQKAYDGQIKRLKDEAEALIRKFENGVRRYKYNRKAKKHEEVIVKATPEQIKKAQAIIDKIVEGKGTRPKWAMIPGSKGHMEYSYISPETMALEEVYKEVFGKSGLKRDGNGFYNLGYFADKAYAAREILDKALAGESETLSVPTEFLKVSKKFDRSRSNPYWSTKVEMFARAFEYFIETKLEDQKARADYLQYDKAPVYDAVYGMNPYPAGEERTALNELFQKFFDEVKTKEEGGRTTMFRTGNIKKHQLDIIKATNPMLDDYHTGIRSITDIKTAQEAFNELIETGEEAAPDFTAADMQRALQTGRITVYSSYPIKNGVFVTPSRMQAKSYAGDGTVYSEIVDISDVAWIDYIEGQYAKISDESNAFRTSNRGTFDPKNDNILFRVIGERGAGAIEGLLDNLSVARKMEEAGRSAKEVFLATGWQRGVDNLWRYETRDIELKKGVDFISKLKPQNEAFTEEVPLTDIIEDEELFNSYPELKDVKLTFYNYGSHPELERTGGFANPSEKTIGIGTENLAATNKGRSLFPGRFVSDGTRGVFRPGLEYRHLYVYDRDSFRSVLSHEIQHHIQRVEGFAEGATAVGAKRAGSPTILYEAAAGEVEARNVQRRLELTPDERRERMLIETEDVARDQQIVIRREFNRQGSTAPGTELINQISRLSDEFNTPVNVIRTKEDLPGHIKADAKRKGLWNNKIEGVYDSGNVYVVLDALSEDNNDAIMGARKVILHEVVAHKGLPSMLGQEAYDNLLDDIYNSIPEDDKKQLEYEYNTKDKRTIAAEYLAAMAENNVNPSLLQRIIAKIREALRWMFNISYSENDIHDMLRRSAKNLRKQGKARPEFAGEYLARQDDISYKTNKPAAQFAGEYLNDPTILQRGAERYQDRKAARSFKESLQGIREYFQDMSLPIRKFEEEVLKRGGKQDNKSKPYRDMFLSFGRMEKLYTDFMEQKMKPVIEAIPPITKTGISGIEILPYIISKHAVERNPVMRGEELRAWVDSHKDATFQEIEDKRESLKDKDYSGVMEFDTKDGKPLGNYTNPDALARDIVAEFEGKVDKALIDNLWAKIGEATRSTLDTWEISKQISPQQKQDYIDKYRFFVPLRGWRDGAAKELVYTRGQGFGKSLRHAEGRKSLADNPLAYIQQVHFQAIGEQVDGEVKEAMLNLVLNNLGNNEIHDLVTIKKLYYMKVPLADGNYEWEPTTTRPPQEMFANGDATTKIYREHERLRTPSQAKEHEVWTNVSKPGGDLVLVFKGEYLSVGQALNRQNYMIRAIWGKILDAREINRLFGVMGHMNNALKAMYTSWNVVFPFTNFMRDFQEASITQYIKLGPRAGKMVVTGYKGAFPAIMRRLAGKPDMNNKMDRDLEDFYNLGGATGYTHNKTIEEIEKEYDRELRGMVRAGTVRGDIANVFRDVFSAINAWNTLFEDATRFSVYLSSIAAGNTREDAAYDAKEASVNFNRKGKGSKAWDAWFAFFNVAIQSLQKNFKLAKDHPGGFTKVAFAWVMLGFLEAVMNAMTDDDDDPDSAYHNINPYMRHNYLLIPNLPRILAKGEKGNKYLSIPLPQFWRGFKSMGALAFDVGTKKAKPKDAVIMALGDFANSLLPIDLGGFYSDGEFSFAPLAPTIVKPAVELAYNRNFMGYTIKKEPFTREQKQLLANSALGKDNVNVAAKFFTDMLYRWSGGESDYRYHIDSKGRTRRVIMDINPSSLEHLFKGYTGGTGGVFSDLISIVAQALDPDEEIDFRDVPFVNKFIRNTPEAKWNIISEYYDLKKENDRDLALMKEYKKKAMETGDTFLYERMATDEYRVRRQQVFDTYEDQIKELTRKEVKDDLETASLAIEMMDYCIGQVKQLDELYRKNRR